MLEVRFHLEAHLWFGPDSSTSSHGVGEWKAEQMQPNVAVVVAPSQAAGLSTRQARALLGQLGPNDPADGKRVSALGQFLDTFRNPLVLILLAAAIISAVLGAALDATIIVVIVLLSNALNFLQTYRSQRAVDRLRQAVAPTASAPRHRVWVNPPPPRLPSRHPTQPAPGHLIPAAAR